MNLKNLNLEWLANLSKYKPLAFYDLETTGTNPTVDRICEICIFRFENGKMRKFTSLIDPLIEIPEGASNVHGITNEVIKAAGAKPLHFYSPIIEEMFKDAVLVTYNGAKFDIPLLIQEFLRIGRSFDFASLEDIDVRTIYVKNNGRKLSDAYREYIGEDMIDAHKAEADVEATIAILEKQIVRHELTGMTLREIIDYSKFENKETKEDDVKALGDVYPDYQKKFVIKEIDGVRITYYNFGKNKGLPCLSTDKQYLKWMLTATDKRTNAPLFMQDTLNHATKLLANECK